MTDDESKIKPIQCPACGERWTAADSIPDERVQGLVDVLEKIVERHWFDAFDKKHESTACWACMVCDMGDSGRKRNADGHDFNCDVSLAREALAKWKGNTK